MPDITLDPRRIPELDPKTTTNRFDRECFRAGVDYAVKLVEDVLDEDGHQQARNLILKALADHDEWEKEQKR